MTSRTIITDIINLKSAPRCGFWLGNPHSDTWPIYHKYFGTSTEEELRCKLGDDFRWITPQYMETTYRHPENKKIFDIWKNKKSHSESGPLADCETINELDKYDWPQIQYLDFTECITKLKECNQYYRASGFWSPFFHDVMDLFGMENYFIKMNTNPDIVNAVTERVCDFYYQANEKFLTEAAEHVDGLFFGNDFGTQTDLIISPEKFNIFVFPWFQKFTIQAHRFGKQVILHSCGSIYRVIDLLIDTGVNCLHPLQAKANNMNAETLSQHFKGRIAFLGGIDTQQLLVHGTCEEIKKEVLRIKSLLGPNLIVSPSHEALLPNVPPQNVAAMAEAVFE